MYAIRRRLFRFILTSFTVTSLPVISAISLAATAAPARSYENNLRLLTYNVYFVHSLVAESGQETRAGLIVNAPFMKNHDVVILNELFDPKASKKLLAGLELEYPYRTPILGESDQAWDATAGAWRPLTLGNGGVAVLSRWPITEQVQFIYSKGCGADAFSRKGFVYIKLNKQGETYHVVGTHAQSEDPGCANPAAIGASQFEEMQEFLSQKNIPVTQVLFIAGDLNVIRNTPDYEAMLGRLQVNEPESYAGANATWDPVGNGLANQHYPQYQLPEYFDYIFVSSRHAQPATWHNQALDTPSPRWQVKESMFQDYSDHYPVAAFAFADASTPTHSVRPDSNRYGDISIRHDASGRIASANSKIADGWLTFLAPAVTLPASAHGSPSRYQSFHLDNWYPSARAFCIRSGDYVQVQSNAYPGYYWNWHNGGGGDNAYFLKKGDGSDRLRLVMAADSGDCLKNGDQVYFKDRDTFALGDFNLTVWPEGKWQDHLFLWTKEAGENEVFTVLMPESRPPEDWTSKLNYGLAQ